mmetsp:Transcript_96481/g.201598  ORF Transcript_96481/g.201598 Transcript_96481/m.201598 type:complete len:210 (-) Transcript_96481:657-1286(-)
MSRSNWFGGVLVCPGSWSMIDHEFGPQGPSLALAVAAAAAASPRRVAINAESLLTIEGSSPSTAAAAAAAAPATLLEVPELEGGVALAVEEMAGVVAGCSSSSGRSGLQGGTSNSRPFSGDGVVEGPKPAATRMIASSMPSSSGLPKEALISRVHLWYAPSLGLLPGSSFLSSPRVFKASGQRWRCPSAQVILNAGEAFSSRMCVSTRG